MLNKVKNSVSGFFKDKKKLTRVYMIVMTVCIMCTMLAVGASAAEAGALDNVGTVADFLWEQIGNVVTTIISTPLLLIPVAVFVVGVVISFAKRFIGR